MSLSDHLSDRRGIAVSLVTAAAGVAVTAAAGAAIGTALLSSAAIGAAVYLAHVLTAWLTARPAAAPDRAAPLDARPWLHRARAVVGRLESQRRGGADPTVARALQDATDHARTAADRLGERAEAIGIIDAQAAGPGADALRSEEKDLLRQARERPPGPLRTAKETSARAIADRAASRERLDELREVLLATLESTVLRLEAAAEHASVLVSMRAAGDAAANPVDLAPLTTELEAVQAGLDSLDVIAQALLDER